jgi:hypothetical protein
MPKRPARAGKMALTGAFVPPATMGVLNTRMPRRPLARKTANEANLFFSVRINTIEIASSRKNI